MNVKEFPEAVERDRHLAGEKAKAKKKEVDLWDQYGHIFGCVGVPRGISTGQAIDD